jgi:hypothetical protein
MEHITHSTPRDVALAEYLANTQHWKDVRVCDSTDHEGGFLSRARVVTVEHAGGTTRLFVKEQNGGRWGAERAGDAFASYSASDSAGEEYDATPHVLGSYVHTNHGTVSLNEILTAKIVQVQEYRPGETLYQHCTPQVTGVVAQDPELIGMRVAQTLAQLHGHKHPMERSERFDEYSRSLRDVLGHPELTLNIMQNFLRTNSVFSGDFRAEYIKEMFSVIDHLSERKDRNALIHGDFWHTNILLHENEVSCVDLSRLHHGEPGIDVGHFYAACLFLAVLQHDDRHIAMARAFLATYKTLTGDADIEDTMVCYIGFTGAVCAVEDFYPDCTAGDRANYVHFIYSCLKDKRMRTVDTWRDIQ